MHTNNTNANNRAIAIAPLVPVNIAVDNAARRAAIAGGLQEGIVAGAPVVPPNATPAAIAALRRQHQELQVAAATASATAAAAAPAGGVRRPSDVAVAVVVAGGGAASGNSSSGHPLASASDATAGADSGSTLDHHHHHGDDRDRAADILSKATAAATATGTPLAGVVHIDDGLCNVCMLFPRNTAFYPCGHMACSGCAAQVRTKFGACHVCRKPISDSLRIYE